MPASPDPHPTGFDLGLVSPPILHCTDLIKTFPGARGQVIRALDRVSFAVRSGSVTGLLGPDGAGKTTLFRIATGLLKPDSGKMEVLGFDLARHPQRVQNLLGYMPQRFGMYEDLTVQQNLDLYADLHGISVQRRLERYGVLMKMTGLANFTGRLAGRLSGGMKQKLALACTLVRTPPLLMLDEPTVGVDPLSRRELWQIIHELVAREGVTVLLSTAYLDEAERCQEVVLLNQGRLLGSGAPSQFSGQANGRVFLVEASGKLKPRQLQSLLIRTEDVVDANLQGELVRCVTGGERPPRLPDGQALRAQAVAPRFEDGFMILLGAHGHGPGPSPPSLAGAALALSPPVGRGEDEAAPLLLSKGMDVPVVVEVKDLVKLFGAFAAVDHISFEVRRGEIFGLLGPNGAGKSTTFRMLCGLLAATGGTLRIAGVDLRHARAEARRRIGYVAQKFSQYGQMSVLENLRFFSSAYGLSGRRRQERIDWALQQFELASVARLSSGPLPEGYKKRLAMACALMHEPEILFLDEPTSGVDPLARREFWLRIGGLADMGVTVIVTTHFMEEAEYCDRMVIMLCGRILAQGSPAEIRGRARNQRQHPTIEDAFVSIIEEAGEENAQR